ncbi:MAG: hypothetical protein GKS03_13455, partial [Alphaproteobacteria bacterium]|nr:hypothetical protein [Alphaproteobacteria bacterium]
MEWHFKLKPNIKFSNGEPVTAQSVKTVFDLMRKDSINALYWSRQEKFYPLVEVIDDLTVAFHTLKPNAVLPAYLSALFIAPGGHVENVGLAAATRLLISQVVPCVLLTSIQGNALMARRTIKVQLLPEERQLI